MNKSTDGPTYDAAFSSFLAAIRSMQSSVVANLDGSINKTDFKTILFSLTTEMSSLNGPMIDVSSVQTFIKSSNDALASIPTSLQGTISPANIASIGNISLDKLKRQSSSSSTTPLTCTFTSDASNSNPTQAVHDSLSALLLSQYISRITTLANKNAVASTVDTSTTTQARTVAQRILCRACSQGSVVTAPNALVNWSVDPPSNMTVLYSTVLAGADASNSRFFNNTATDKETCLFITNGATGIQVSIGVATTAAGQLAFAVLAPKKYSC